MLRSRAKSALVLALLVASCSAGYAQDATTPVAPASSTSAEAPLPDAPSTAQPAANDFHSFGSAATTIGKDELHFLKYPFQKKAIVWDLAFVGATAALITQDETVLEQVPQSWHHRSILISNSAMGADIAIPGGILIDGLITHNDHAKQAGLRSVEAAIDSMALYGAAKAIFARQRPFSGTGEGNFFAGNWSNGSFPSGHAMLTWTLASTVAHEYHSPWLKVLVYGLAATVSTARVTSREHFPADVFVGSIVGYGVGAYVGSKDRYANEHAYSQHRLGRWRDAALKHVTIQ